MEEAGRRVLAADRVGAGRCLDLDPVKRLSGIGQLLIVVEGKLRIHAVGGIAALL